MSIVGFKMLYVPNLNNNKQKKLIEFYDWSFQGKLEIIHIPIII